MVLKCYQGAITISDLRSMPNRELMGYINAIPIIEGGEPADPKSIIEQMKNDPAIKVI